MDLVRKQLDIQICILGRPLGLGIITIYMIFKTTGVNEITVGLSGDKEEIQGMSSIAFGGQGDEEEATKKT